MKMYFDVSKPSTLLIIINNNFNKFFGEDSNALHFSTLLPSPDNLLRLIFYYLLTVLNVHSTITKFVSL